MAVAIAGCGDDDDNRGTAPAAPTTAQPPTGQGDGPARPDRPVVELTLDRTAAKPGDTLELTIANHGRRRLEYGAVYALERRTDDGWRWINRDAAFIAILKVVEPRSREHEQIGLPDDLEPGRYRIAKSFSHAGSERRIRATVGFRVG